MIRRIADSIMAGFRFQPVAGFGIGERDGKEKEREDDAKDVGHTWLRLLKVIREVAGNDELGLLCAEVVGGQLVGVLKADFRTE